MTATAHIITGVIGSGVLSLAWTVAVLGWIAGPLCMLAFAVITWYTSILLADCYRHPHPVSGTRNYTYMDVVRNNLGGLQVKLCGIAQYGNLVGSNVGYTITASISMMAITKVHCYQKNGENADCSASLNPSMIIFGVIQIILSQIPNFNKLSWLSMIAAIMSFTYSSIGLGLSAAKLAGGGNVEKMLTGIPVGPDLSAMEKMWSIYSAIGNIAFAYSFSLILVEIQDTLKSGPPENKVMKDATLIAISISTVFYMLCGVLGYAAFGNAAPGNLLTGFKGPIWLVDFANLCVAIHIVGAYQVYVQPLYGFVEDWSSKKWPNSKFINGNGTSWFNPFRLVWRTAYVILLTVIAMMFPFFNDIMGLLGAAGFWPLTVYFPIEMYLSQTQLKRSSFKWMWLQALSLICLIVSILSAAGSTYGIVKSLTTYKLFHAVS
ncbi:hypothetical protein Leryth_008463 [Lithospermum erythrorhizon]|nr:hypothetical protein Leryth_008463 [Lithospermum erythrorhizon]